MSIPYLKWFCLAALFFLTVMAQLSAQQPAAVQDTQKLKIETAFLVEYFVRGEKTLQKLSGSVRLRQKNTLVYCDTAILDEDYAILKNNVVITQGDSVKVFSDSAHYDAATKISDLYSNVVLENGKQQLFTKRLRYDTENKIATYSTGAVMSNGKSRLTSRRGRYEVNNKMVFLKGDVTATDPEFTMRTDTMTYNTELQTVYFVAPTRITQPDAKVYTEGGFYDIENNFSEFDLNPQFERGAQRGIADKMRYSGLTKEYVLEGKAFIKDTLKGEKAAADFIRYHSETKKTVLRGNAFYYDSVRNIRGAEIRYDELNKSYQVLGRGSIVDPPNTVTGDSLDFNDALGVGMALGNVVWEDTSANVTVLSNRMDYNKKSDYLHASGGYGAGNRPLMKSLVDRDTLYMCADTLTSYKPDTASDVRLLLAHRDVRIFKTDLQATCDSLSFSSADSVFRFYKIFNLPVIWSDTSQFSGDTIHLLLKNKKMDRIWLRQNAFVVNSEDGLLFNQIKGRYVTAWFRNQEVREMLVDGNAQAVYYALDDQRAYIGVNESTCAEMRLYFGDNKVNSIRFYAQPEGKFTPMKKAGKDTKRLEGFFWERTRRPRSVADLFELAGGS